MDDGVIISEEVDFLNALDVLQVQLLKGRGQLLVVTDVLDGALGLSSGGTSTTDRGTSGVTTEPIAQ